MIPALIVGGIILVLLLRGGPGDEKKRDHVRADKQRRQELHDQHKARIWEDIQSSTDSFDQSLLTLSSGALGLSLAFIKDVVPLKEAIWVSLLYASWGAFAACIVVTVVSFLLSIAANKQQLAYIDDYYLNDNPDAFNKQESSRYVKGLQWCTRGAIIFFVAGLLSTIIFVIANVARYRMSDIKGKGTSIKVHEIHGGRQPIGMTRVGPIQTQDGRQPVAMTPNPQGTRGRQPLPLTSTASTPLEKGRQPVGMTPVKPAQPSQPAPQPPKSKQE